jgi:hypothetical protein
MQIVEDLAGDGNRIVLVVLSVMSGDFDVQEPVGIFAENHGEIHIPLRPGVEPLEIAALGETGYELGAVDRIDGYESGFDGDLEG